MMRWVKYIAFLFLAAGISWASFTDKKYTTVNFGNYEDQIYSGISSGNYKDLPTGYVLQAGSPLHHFKMQEASGNADDVGSLNKDLTATGTLVYSQSSPIASDYSVLFGDQGGASSGRFTNTASPNETFTLGAAENFTLVIWLKTHSSAAEDQESAALFEIKDATNNYPIIEVYFDSAEIFRVSVKDDANAEATAWISKANLWTTSQSDWKMLVVQGDRSAAALVAEVNGEDLAGGTGGDFSAMGALTFSNDHLTIGTRRNNSTKDFSGWIAEVWLAKGLTYTSNF